MSLKMVFEHLFVVITASFFTILIGLPLGIYAYLNKHIQKTILWIADILQTIPALALLGIIMVFLGAGKITVITGLVLYSLLPVVHNTCLGLSNVDPAIREAALGMGMNKFQRLILVELPIAFPVIFTGIRIAVVTSIGVAVFGAYVGSGGLGSIINNGIRVQNMKLILTGTATLMVMAVAFDSLMGKIEHRLYSKTSNTK